MKIVLLVDFGSTYTKLTAVDVDSEGIIATARSFTTIQTDINDGLNEGIRKIEEKIGRQEYDAILGCSSAAGGLKMVTVGLVPDLTAEAGKRAALSAGAKVTGVFCYELSIAEKDQIEEMKPDILLLTGGTDGGNRKVVLHNATVIANIKGDFPVVVACNKSAIEEVVDILKRSGKEVINCKNVMPTFNELDIEGARRAIREVFLHRIIRAKGLSKVQELVKGILMPTPSAVLKALQLLSEGVKGEAGIGELVAVDVGGATTDVYSICDGNPTKAGVILKGLPQAYANRTVEGDLGVRYSSSYLVEIVGIDEVSKLSGLERDKINKCLDKIRANPELLALGDEELQKFDTAMAKLAVKIAVRRHAGTLESVFTPMGQAYVQTGKDLLKVKRIIGTGGPIISNPEASELLKMVMQENDSFTVLLPEKADIYVDKKYILAAMGLLSERYPEIALHIMKRELERICSL